jgi:hypothetical protein
LLASLEKDEDCLFKGAEFVVGPITVADINHAWVCSSQKECAIPAFFQNSIAIQRFF